MPDIDLSRLKPDEREIYGMVPAATRSMRAAVEIAARKGVRGLAVDDLHAAAKVVDASDVLLRRLAALRPSEEEVAAAERIVQAELRGYYAPRSAESVCAHAVLRAAGRE